MNSISQSSAWKALTEHRKAIDVAELKQLAAADAKRVESFSLSLPGLHADFSRHLATAETFRLLVKLAETAQVTDQRRQLFEGVHLNNTEDRAALHTLLRAAPTDVPPGLQAQAAEVRDVFGKLKAFTHAAHA